MSNLSPELWLEVLRRSELLPDQSPTTGRTRACVLAALLVVDEFGTRSAEVGVRLAELHSAAPVHKPKQVLKNELGVPVISNSWHLDPDVAGVLRWLLAFGRLSPVRVREAMGTREGHPKLSLAEFLREPVRHLSHQPAEAQVSSVEVGVDWEGWSPSPRFGTPVDRRAANQLGEYEEVAALLGVRLMPWQKHVLSVATEQGSDSLPVYDDVVVSVGRQQGKSLLMLVVILRWLRRGNLEGAYVSATLNDALRLWKGSMWRLLEASPLVDDWSLKLNKGAMGAALVCDRFGSVCHILSGSREAGHGLSLNFAVCDEGWAYTDARHEESLEPAMSTFPDAQMWLISTAGDSKSIFLRDKVELNRAAISAGGSAGSCYFEWSAPPDSDHTDPEVWRHCMPALGRTITTRRTQNALARRGQDHFRRTRLNEWQADSTTGDVGVFPGVMWRDVCAAMAMIGDFSKVWVAVDAPPSQNRCAVAVCDGATVGLVRYDEGWGWIEEFLGRLIAARKVQRVLVPGLSIEDPVRAACNAQNFLHLEVVTTATMALSAARLKADVIESRVRVKESSWVTAAVTAAREHPLTHERGWVFRHRPETPQVDISPLWAIALAWHGARRAAEERDKAPRVLLLGAD